MHAMLQENVCNIELLQKSVPILAVSATKLFYLLAFEACCKKLYATLGLGLQCEKKKKEKKKEIVCNLRSSISRRKKEEKRRRKKEIVLNLRT